ncbi:Elongation factor 1-delta [Liparis tanakae]|uniref:Elongation factor 1-delta n=1 Tax=Liparis tanakae TaxID=230148 RepID=A0A4Z2GF34_9TELE|nr:Elongation factor 1-delta [Liparis tanakae]
MDQSRPPPPSSPRSPHGGNVTSPSGPSRGQQQDRGHPVGAAKAAGVAHRRYIRGRNRTSSETERGGKGSKGPTRRRRGFSETESRPRWDKYASAHTGNGQDAITKMSGLQCLASDNVWLDKQRYDEAEKCFYAGANGASSQAKTALVQPKAPAQKRRHRNSSSHAGGDQELVARMKSMELENHTLHKVVEEMRAALQKLESRVVVLEKSPAAAVTCVKWDDETDMAKLEECVRSIQMDGLLWGSGKLVAVGYGIKKLQINCVVEDDKVGTDILEEEITKFEDYIQSVDVAAFNKI